MIEPHQFDEFSVVIDESKLLVLPYSNHGDGPGEARNYVWEHSKRNGFARHWVMDDNIKFFARLHQNRRIRCADGGLFRAIEDFVDRFENVRVAG